MLLETLKELVDRSVNDPNYQYKDLSKADRFNLAKKSFLKLSPDQIKQAEQSWAKYCNRQLTEDDKKDLMNYRFLAQTNLFFLCQLLEKYNQVTVKTHEDICNKFFVAKDPTAGNFEKFARAYPYLKDRLLLVPRGGFKSSIDIADCVQWIICFPEITILILTGKLNLAEDFVGELKAHFTYAESGKFDQKKKPIYGPRLLQDRETGDWSSSLFQVLFPEHCVVPSDGKGDEFQSPACIAGDKEPTVRAASIEQSLSGMHFGLMKLDDVVTNENSLTLTRMQAVNRQISINRAMLHPYGFMDVIGTWYDECLVADTPILMGDWTHKKIADVKVGDIVVSWELRNNRNWLTPSKVTAVGKYDLRPVNKYTFESGRSVVATATHRWWRGAQGSGEDYKHIGLGYHKQKYVRRLLVPTQRNESRDAGWLSGVYDGEGSFQKNKNHPSGSITLSQTTLNPGVIERLRKTFYDLGFRVTEQWYKITKKNHHDKCEFKVRGGWKERYRFMTEIAPSRFEKMKASLWGQNKTEKDHLVSVEPQGEQPVYWFQTALGNYVADGCCSKNSDYYGITIKHEELLVEEDGPAAKTIEVYLRAAWWPTPECVALGKVEAEMTKDDYILWFPERLPYDFLLRERKKDAEGFAIKYLNDPRQIHKVKFPRELLLRRTIPHNQLPQQGIIVTTVDTAYSVKNWADYTVIMTALIYGGRFYIINMVRGRFNEYELPQVIAASAYKWKPKRIAIEDSMGVKWMGRELRREMDKLNITIPVEYVSLGQGNKSKSKQLKAKPVMRLLGDERLFFANSCEGLLDIYAELEKFTGTSDDAHDDVVSGLSILVDVFSAYADMEAKVNFAGSQYVQDQRAKEKHDLIYGLGRYAKLTNNFADDNPTTQFQLGKQVETVTDFDPLQDLFQG